MKQVSCIMKFIDKIRVCYYVLRNRDVAFNLTIKNGSIFIPSGHSALIYGCDIR